MLSCPGLMKLNRRVLKWFASPLLWYLHGDDIAKMLRILSYKVGQSTNRMLKSSSRTVSLMIKGIAVKKMMGETRSGNIRIYNVTMYILVA